MKVLSVGSRGPEVEDWQHFLNGTGILCEVDGHFGEETKECTIRFQSRYSCPKTGKLDRGSYAIAIRQGYLDVQDDDDKGSDWPPIPKDIRPMNSADKKDFFGNFSYKPNPTSSNPEKVDIDDAWEKANIDRYQIPQLSNITGYMNSGVFFNKKVGPKVQQLFKELEKEKLIDKILTWNGSYVTRFIRGSRRTLSNHCYGSAFDINVTFNRLGSEPAQFGTKGSVREIVPIANKIGFWWGGHFSRRKDGMHFELATKNQ